MAGGIAGALIGGAFGALNAAIKGEDILAGVATGAVSGLICGAVAGGLATDIVTGGVGAIGTVAAVSFLVGAGADAINQLANDVSIEELNYTSMLQSGTETALITTLSTFVPSAGGLVADVIIDLVYNANTAGIQTVLHLIYEGIKGRAAASEFPEDTVIPIY